MIEKYVDVVITGFIDLKKNRKIYTGFFPVLYSIQLSILKEYI